MKQRTIWTFLALIWVLALVGGCKPAPTPTPAPEVQKLILATTTSTYDSGLLDHLLPDFEVRYNARVEVIAVGTGQAIKTAEQGDADVILVHARAKEDKFVADGYGVNRQDVMYNDFVIIGPQDDPAGIQGMTDAAAALAKIAESQTAFASRGDESGTHSKEKAIWDLLGKKGYNVGIFNYPTLSPPPKVNGFAVSGVGAYTKEALCFPEELEKELDEVTNGYETKLNLKGGRYKKNIHLFFEDLNRVITKQVAALRYLVQEKEWDFFGHLVCSNCKTENGHL